MEDRLETVTAIFVQFLHKNVHEVSTNLHSTVEETAVLARLVEQSFGGGQRQHAPRLVGFPQIAPWLPEELDPCHWLVGLP